MPGGSVNGRPFREDSTSYSYTGIPRGNPKRAFHHGVMQMGSSQTPKLTICEEKIETEGEKQLKALAKKQIHTDVTLESQLKERKQFTSGVLYKPLVEDIQGQISLQEYEQLTEKDRQIEELRQCGLTKEELELKLAHQGSTPDKKRRLGVDPAVQEMRLQEIEEKILKKKEALSQPDVLSGIKKLTRHEYDLEQSLLRTGTESEKNIFSKLTRKANSGGDKLDLTVNNCNSTTDLFETTPEQTQDNVEVAELTAKFCLKCNKIFKSESDVKICEECVRGCCAETREDGPATLCGPVKTIHEDSIKKNRLSMEEIKDMPRFKDYSPGTRNKTLYLKNLASGVTEFDLVSLFGRFQSKDGPKVVYRLMTGRMKGQAFITFEDEDTATAALGLTNGYKLMGKPLVIQYGKKTTADKG